MATQSLIKQYQRQVKRLQKIIDELEVDIEIKEVKKPNLKTIENLKTINKKSLESFLKGTSKKKNKNITTYLKGIKSPSKKKVSSTKTKSTKPTSKKKVSSTKPTSKKKVSSTKPKSTKPTSKKKVSSTKPKSTKNKVSSTKPTSTKKKVSSTKPESTELTPTTYTALKSDAILFGNRLLNAEDGDFIEEIDLSKYDKDGELDFKKLQDDYSDYNIIKEEDFYANYDYITTEDIIDERLEHIFEIDSTGARILRETLNDYVTNYGKEVIYKVISDNQAEILERLDKCALYGTDNEDTIDNSEFEINYEAILHVFDDYLSELN